MSVQQAVTPESQQIETYQKLIERKRVLEGQIIRIETELNRAEQDLKEISDEAERLFKTREIEELKTLYRTKMAENDIILKNIDAAISDAEAIVAKILKDMEAQK
jgi:hypothetical protein